MPREHKKRGRREEARKRKRGLDDRDEDIDDDHKRRKSQTEPSEPSELEPEGESASNLSAAVFYGLLDDEEQAYFRDADQMLELDQFEDPEARRLFLDNVYKEAAGKELKIASSQSCSRFLERMILLSSPQQVKALFRAFNGHFLNLVQHRFASHCCEALFVRAAPTVSAELQQSLDLQTPPSSSSEDVFVSAENLFLFTMAELEEHIGYLITDRFASHVLRLLLTILSGAPLERQSKSALQSKKKEKVGISGIEKANETLLEKRTVPQSFLEALERVINERISAIDTQSLRMFATHPIGNPTLQVLLKLELSHFGKSRAKDEKSIIHRLLPDDPIAEGTESASFINGLVYDTIGSRLLETIIENAPGKLFKTIYAEFFRERMGSLARNEIAGYVAGKVLERLGKDDLEEAMRQIVDQIPSLVERNRTAIIKTLIERCAAREVDTSPIMAQLEIAYSGPNGFDVTRILKLGESPGDDEKASGKQDHSPEKMHGSLLAQTMMSVQGALGNLIFDSLAKLSSELSVQLARDRTASRTLQAALTSRNASVIFRRKMIQQFYGHVGELALDPAASRVIDAIWDGTHGLAFIRERIAEELAENENSLRESFVGRAVWRNWRMDLYKRKRHEWVKESRYTAGNDGFQSFPENDEESKSSASHPNRPGRHLTALELARQRHAARTAEAKRRDAQTSKHHKKDRKDKHGSSSVSSGSSKGKAKASVMAQ